MCIYYVIAQSCILSRRGPALLFSKMSRRPAKVEGQDAMPSYVKRHVRKTRAERRQEIIDATQEVLGEYGLAGATVARIAATAGLTPGALYRHFESRDAMLAAAHDEGSRQAMSWLDTSAESDVARRLEELGEAHAAWTKNHLSRVVRPFFQALAAFSQQANLAGQMSLPRIRIYQAFVDIAEEGKRQGTIRSDVDSADVAWCMLMIAWTEDIALMLGAEEFIAGGTFGRGLGRMLDSFRPDGIGTKH